MTESPEPDPTRDLTPGEESRVRRLLADARHTEPMPDDVVTRLDRVLADLADEPDRESAVVSLAARRRRVTRLLVAAAAVVVVGVVGSQVVGGLGGMTASEDSQTAAEAPDQESAEEPPAAGGDSSADREPSSEQPRGEGEVTVSKARVAKVRPQSFAADAEAIRDGSAAFLNDSDAARQGDGAAVCTAGNWGAGRYVAVRYAGDPGWIVYRRPQGDTQVADLFLCGSEVASRSLTLPYP